MAASAPVTPVRTTRSPRPQSWAPSTLVLTGLPSTSAAGSGPSYLPTFRSIVPCSSSTAQIGQSWPLIGVAGRVAGGELVLLRRERESSYYRSFYLITNVATAQAPERVRLAGQLGRAERAQVEVPPPGRFGLPPVPVEQVG